MKNPTLEAAIRLTSVGKCTHCRHSFVDKFEGFPLCKMGLSPKQCNDKYRASPEALLKSINKVFKGG